MPQPTSGLGSTAETNRLLGGNYFDEKTGAQIKPFTPSPKPTESTTGGSSSTGNASQVSIISSQQGLKDLNTATTKETKLTTPSIPPPTDTGTKAPITTYKTDTSSENQAPAGTKGTFINADGQTFESTDVNPETIQKFKDKGYDLMEGSGSSSSIFDSPEVLAAKAAAESAKSELDTWKNKLFNFDVSKDPTLQGTLSAITSAWDARIADMATSNASANAAMKTTGYRTGMQFTGGMGGPMGTIISAQERVGLQKIAELEGQKQDALIGARSAFEDKQWDKYVKLVDLADTSYKNQLAEYTNLRKAAEEQNKALIQSSRDSAIAGLVKQGVTDPVELMDYLNFNERGQQVGDFTTKEVADALKNLFPTGTGIVGEYQFYSREAKRMGQVPLTFEEYQNEDANRKRPITNINNSGLPAKTVAQVDKLSSSFDSSPIVKQYNEVQNKKLGFDAIINSKVGGPGDMALVYEFMKALDPTSVVRETEYDSAAKSGNIFAGSMARFNGYFKESGGILPDQVKASFKKIVDSKYEVAGKQYTNLRQETARKINMKTGEDDGTDYLTDYSAATGVELNRTEEEWQQKVIDFGKQTPDVREHIKQLAGVVQPETGRAYTWEEIAQILGIQ